MAGPGFYMHCSTRFCGGAANLIVLGLVGGKPILFLGGGGGGEVQYKMVIRFWPSTPHFCKNHVLKFLIRKNTMLYIKETKCLMF